MKTGDGGIQTGQWRVDRGLQLFIGFFVVFATVGLLARIAILPAGSPDWFNSLISVQEAYEGIEAWNLVKGLMLLINIASAIVLGLVGGFLMRADGQLRWVFLAGFLYSSASQLIGLSESSQTTAWIGLLVLLVAATAYAGIATGAAALLVVPLRRVAGVVGVGCAGCLSILLVTSMLAACVTALVLYGQWRGDRAVRERATEAEEALRPGRRVELPGGETMFVPDHFSSKEMTTTGHFNDSLWLFSGQGFGDRNPTSISMEWLRGKYQDEAGALSRGGLPSVRYAGYGGYEETELESRAATDSASPYFLQYYRTVYLMDANLVISYDVFTSTDRKVSTEEEAEEALKADLEGFERMLDTISRPDSETETD